MMGLSWLIPWEPSVLAMLGFALVAVLYGRGGFYVSLEHRILFWSGFAFLYVASQTQFDYYAEHEFFVHRIQHGLLQHFGPFLIALSHPGRVLMAGLPERGRQFIRFIVLPRPLWAFLIHPAVQSLIFSGLIVLWLIPPALFAAMLDWRLYRLMEGTMIVSGLMFWHMAFDERVPLGQRIAAMLSVIPAQIAAGALLVFSPEVFYPVYSICGRAFANIDALDDQKIGGLILWIHGAMMSVIGILVVARSALMTNQKALSP